MSIQQPILTSQQKNEITNYINVYRTLHQAPPFVWDDTIASFSQQWSYHLLSSNLFQHSDISVYGENLAYFKGYGNDVMVLLKKAIDSWYNEVSLYDFNKPGFSKETGHFTCLVWKSSKKFGMGISIDMTTNKVDITMNTSPPGNYIGEFDINVLPINPGVNPLPTPLPSPIPPHIPIPSPLPPSNYPYPPPTQPPSNYPYPPPPQPPSNYPYPPPPQPPTPPSPTPNNKTIIIYALYNIINALQNNQSKMNIIMMLNNLIDMVNKLPM